MTHPRPEFLSLQPGAFASDDNTNQSPIQPHLDTLFAEFSRSRHRLTPPPRSPAALRRPRTTIPVQDVQAVDHKVDLRALDYVSDYDSHLMCPICHVPFVDPVVLDCDHTFCNLCFEEYRDGAENSPRTQCPTCRAYLLSQPHKASRLIVNMCNDIKVRCPNEDCDTVHSRGCIEQHATKDCPEYLLDCPGSDCSKVVKRKNFVPEQCIHSSHIECDCGAVIELGRGEWLRHKDEDCPTTGVKCDVCSERISVKDYLAGRDTHVCSAENSALRCPGYEYGCVTNPVFGTSEDLEYHTQTCPLARLAPHLKKQSSLLQSLTDQLTLTKVRNEVLETSLDKITDLLNTRILPSIPSQAPTRAPSPTPSSLSIEEIPRHSDPPLALPAHLRPLTPNPPATGPSGHPHLNELDILNLHTHLSDSMTNLSTQLLTVQNNLADLDARTSMMVMNETLRLKEDLAQQGAGLFSTRAQVQWLLNRERERMQMAHAHAQSAASQSQTQGQGPGSSSGGAGGPAERPGFARGRSSNIGLGEGSSSARSSFSHGTGDSVSVSPRVAPRAGGRRLSGSQERVKL
ncbi:uncharacterized protein HMPREF1541_10071 [Cyphellophora europaea CBS 101466]|uniref:RING-type domain-containing protein n=1 Tax=Cyphellophora europaea (strain CBS 101466) TaxID=1220924 RepID=W2SB95_CYPE1|nr:uncharacterized protein HMPREF1541_10071 [Cyphellophora europaea CBS 101466]ETN45194.1 hypothetical protein HMPREF1541_10071 [Cyphellophora europaea CBS 101466]